MLSDITSKHLTYEVLSTLMAEVSAIINAPPLVPVSNDQDCPHILSPSMLLTQKSSSSVNYAYLLVDPRLQKKYVQSLAGTVWKRWHTDFSHTLQQWHNFKIDKPNLEIGDVVLFREMGVDRNSWPFGIVVRVFPSKDGNVRKATVRVCHGDKSTTFIRPLVSEE